MKSPRPIHLLAAVGSQNIGATSTLSGQVLTTLAVPLSPRAGIRLRNVGLLVAPNTASDITLWSVGLLVAGFNEAGVVGGVQVNGSTFAVRPNPPSAALALGTIVFNFPDIKKFLWTSSMNFQGGSLLLKPIATFVNANAAGRVLNWELTVIYEDC